MVGLVGVAGVRATSLPWAGYGTRAWRFRRKSV